MALHQKKREQMEELHLCNFGDMFLDFVVISRRRCNKDDPNAFNSVLLIETAYARSIMHDA